MLVKEFAEKFRLSEELAEDILRCVIFGEPTHSDFASALLEEIFPNLEEKDDTKRNI